MSDRRRASRYRQQRCMGAVRSLLYDDARLTDDQFEERRQRIFDSPDWTQLVRYRQEWILGYMEGRRERSLATLGRGGRVPPGRQGRVTAL